MKMLALIAGCLLLVAGARAATLTFTETVTVSGERVFLRDAATIDAPAAEMAVLKDVVLASAPPLGQRKALTLGMIRMRLRQYYLNPDTMTFCGPTTIYLLHALPPVVAQLPTELAIRWLHTQLPAGDGEEIVITPLPATAAAMPADGVTWSCADAEGSAGGVRNVRVTALNAGAPVWETVVRLKVQRFADVLVARTALPRGVPVTARDVAVERREVSEGSETPLRDLAGVAGYRTTATLPAGHPLCASELAPLPVVKAHEQVKLLAHCGALTISLLAMAGEDGAVGQFIRVHNLQSNKDVSARVTAPGEVEIVP